MIVSYVFVLTFWPLFNIFFTKTCLVETGQRLGEYSLIVHAQYMVDLRNNVLNYVDMQILPSVRMLNNRSYKH